MPASYAVRSSTEEVSIDDLFPSMAAAQAPFEVVIGEHFDTLTVPRPAALEVIRRYEWLRPHPVGAAVARALTDEWVFILPPGSGYGMQWSWPAEHCGEGVLAVPPLSAGPDDDLRWARAGNERGRVFSAPFLLLFALCPSYPVSVRADRTPVRI
ncbi:hypothetical protein [Streptomyces sp. NPDC018711]|uniref:hypothetical protein n=1 Tax=Streptomyces sp. NPDC018711 TaxID=3365052 RepID=UPI0037AE7D6A